MKKKTISVLFSIFRKRLNRCTSACKARSISGRMHEKLPVVLALGE